MLHVALLSAGCIFGKTMDWCSALVTTGFDNIKADDFSRTDFAPRGIDHDDLDDRDRSIEAGIALT